MSARTSSRLLGLNRLNTKERKSPLAAIQVKEVQVRLPRLPEELRGLRLVQISDVHIGPLLRKDWLQGVVDRVQSLSPDLIAITPNGATAYVTNNGSNTVTPINTTNNTVGAPITVSTPYGIAITPAS